MCMVRVGQKTPYPSLALASNQGLAAAGKQCSFNSVATFFSRDMLRLMISHRTWDDDQLTGPRQILPQRTEEASASLCVY